jgi:hypothetical protein
MGSKVRYGVALLVVVAAVLVAVLAIRTTEDFLPGRSSCLQPVPLEGCFVNHHWGTRFVLVVDSLVVAALIAFPPRRRRTARPGSLDLTHPPSRRSPR